MTEVHYLSREQYNEECNAAQPPCELRTAIFSPGSLDPKVEQNLDLGIDPKGRKPASYKLDIPPEPDADKPRICLKYKHDKKNEPQPEERICLHDLRKPKEPVDDGHVYELPGNHGKCLNKSQRDLVYVRQRQHQEELDQFAKATKGQFLVTQQQKKGHLEFNYPTHDGFTLTKLKEWRRAEAKSENEKQRKAFIEKDRP